MLQLNLSLLVQMNYIRTYESITLDFKFSGNQLQTVAIDN